MSDNENTKGLNPGIQEQPAAQDIAQDAAPDAALEGAQDSSQDAAIEDVQDAAQDTALEGTQDIAQDAALDGAPDAALEESRPLLEMRPEEKQPYWTAARRKNLREWVVSLLIAVVAVVIVRSFLFTVIRVDGPSMQETLINGDRLIVSILDMKIVGPKRGDVVICHFPGDEPEGNIIQKTWGNIWRDRYVKRVIGMPGDTVEIRDNVTYVNGEALDEAYVVHAPRGDYGPEVVPEGHYLVMGDNRGNSHDSRYDDVGALPRSAMLGKVRLIMWPPADMGVVK